jgi:hypothetical protein
VKFGGTAFSRPLKRIVGASFALVFGVIARVHIRAHGVRVIPIRLNIDRNFFNHFKYGIGVIYANELIIYPSTFITDPA